MKRRLILYGAFSMVLILLYGNYIINRDFHISMMEYFRYSKGFTQEEKEYLKEKNVLIYGADKSSPPLRFVDENSGQFRGVVIDYLSAVSIETGAQIEFMPYQWAEAIERLEKGETDFADMFISHERGQKFDFTLPLYTLKGMIMIPKSQRDINKVEDLRGKRVAMVKGDYAKNFLEEKSIDCHCIFTQSVKEALVWVAQGNADCIIGDGPVINYYYSTFENYEELKVSQVIPYENQVVLAVKKGDKKLVHILNKSILHIAKTDELNKIQEKWTGLSETVEQFNGLRSRSFILVIILIIFGGVVNIFFQISKKLKEEIDNRTSELCQSNKDLEHIFESLSKMMAVVDKDQKVVKANSKFVEMTQQSQSVQGKKVCLLIDFEDPHKLQKMCQQVFATGEPMEMEQKMENGMYHISIYPMLSSWDMDKRAIISIQNVTFKKLNEAKLLHINKMTAIGELAAGMAHEIRNPLGIIRSYLYVIKNYGDNKDQEETKYLEGIENNVEQIKRIIDNLLNFSRIAPDEKECFPLKKFFEGLLFLEEKRMSELGIQAEILCDEQAQITVVKESLKHIFINLISNAIDAMEEGKLTIKAKPWEQGFILSVRDTGMGMNENTLHHVFDPFYTTKPQNKGTGLGLFIAYNESIKIGGELTVKSQLGEGSEFTLQLGAN